MSEHPRIPGYRIVRKVGAGGMAAVYEAVQESLDRPVALKVMAPSLSADENFAGRFLREGRTVARLSHPNIVAIHDIGEANHRHFMAMEYLDGGDLKARVREGLADRVALRVLRSVAGALDYAHGEGFVHRDVKPENILFHGATGEAKLGDFGIARAVDASTRITGTGMSVGTPHYMSPEQCQGEHDIDGRSDLYSLGVVFYEMLTGNVPFDAANTVGIVMKHVQAPLPQLPPGLQQYQPLLDRLLAKNRNDRYGDAGALIEAIDALSEGRPDPARKQAKPARTKVVRTPAQPKSQKAASPPPPAVQASSKARGVLWGLGGAALATILGLAAWYAMQPTTQPGGGASLPAMQAAASKSQGEAPQPKVTQSTPSPLERQLAPPPSGLKVRPRPADARIYVDGNFKGVGELDLTDLTSGKMVTVRAESQGHDPVERRVRVPSNAMADVDLYLKRAITQFALTIEPDPSDARIRILNIGPKYQPGMLLEPGRYQVEASAEGYVTKTGWVEIVDRAVRATVSLEAERPKYIAGQIFRDCPECPEMVVIPAGNFMMGSPQSEKGRENDESPQHMVIISKPFALGRYEVTFEEYDVFVRATGRSLPKDNGWGSGRRPVINVSRNDAADYAAWLSKRTGQQYRLPSEAEWEYAARSGSDTAYWWGDNIGQNRANCSGCGSRWDKKQTAPVGSFAANLYGLHDMHGNVWEWTQDCWNGGYSGAPADGSAWTQGVCNRRVLRGGSWYSDSRDLRASSRGGVTASNRSINYGFRIARDIR